MRLCGTLVLYRYLIRLPSSKYMLGPKLLILGNVYEKSNTMISLARPILRELSRITGESSALYALEGLYRLCLAEQEGSLPVRYVMTEGRSLDLYAGAGGKALLAYAPETTRDEILKKLTFKRLTESTITDRHKLIEEFETIRQKGYALSLGERIPELAAMAVPVYDSNRQVCAVLSIGGLIQRVFRGAQAKISEAPQRGSAGTVVAHGL